jgi:preprotein translocase subunit SecG
MLRITVTVIVVIIVGVFVDRIVSGGIGTVAGCSGSCGEKPCF